MAPLDHGADVKVPPPLIYVVFLALGILANLWYPLRLLPAPLGWALGGLLIAAGALLGPIWGVHVLRRTGTTIRPDRPSQKLVTSGPFRFSRNPLYLALTLIYAGAAIVANSGWALLLLIPVMLIMARFVIGREEAYLARTFGEEYDRYKATVRRWL
jgi:protein-S-isoprenylcysteine O-methyltransferase Ste14